MQNLSRYLIALTIYYVIPNFMSQCSYQQGIDLFGNDLYLTYTKNIDQCCSACSADINCNAWTYVPETQACWVKSSMGSVRLAVSQRKQIIVIFVIFNMTPPPLPIHLILLLLCTKLFSSFSIYLS